MLKNANGFALSFPEMDAILIILTVPRWVGPPVTNIKKLCFHVHLFLKFFFKNCAHAHYTCIMTLFNLFNLISNPIFWPKSSIQEVVR